MTPLPRLSVIVPVLNGRAVLPRCVDALEASTLPRSAWELLVVDDGSTDGTRDWAAEHADEVLVVEGGPHGPARARNRGARAARGSILVFIDADVCVHRDVLERFSALFRDRPDVVAAFGTYDADPEVPGFVSVYRNLLHRYVHLRDAGEAKTFWAGCGAVRREVFLEAGGFDEERFGRPQIEDIELGYRLTDEGHRIVLDPMIEVAHLKRWTLTGMIRTDLMDRGIPWMRLLLERPEAPGGEALNLRPAEKMKTALAGASLALVVLALVLGRPLPFAVAAGFLALLAAANAQMYRWFAEQRGWLFALAVVPMSFLYYVLNGVAAALGTLAHGWDALTDAGGNRKGSRPRVGRGA